jgi:branched-subunit amino acid aminotransferase/4-amino-4-deoxychorismate lyase
VVIDIAGQIGVEVIEGFFEPQDLLSSEEAFLTFTTAGVVPIHSVNGSVISGGMAGPVTRRIIERYEEVLESETRSVTKGI